jgi:hypothetical protein
MSARTKLRLEHNARVLSSQKNQADLTDKNTLASELEYTVVTDTSNTAPFDSSEAALAQCMNHT